jgi:hypothetical protein
MKYGKLLPNQRENLRAIIEESIELTNETSGETKGRCPFCHGGRTGEITFALNKETGLSMCHRATCAWKGNAVTLISELLNLSYEKARAALDGAQDISLESILSLMDYDETTPFEKMPESVWINNAYKPSRYPSGVFDWLLRRNYDPDQFVQQHSLWMPPDGLYNGRCIFQVNSFNVTAYQLYDYTGKMQRKTINPEGEFLSRTLYQYNNGKAINEESEDYLLIHEGIFDVARSLTRGYNAVCVFGTNLSSHQEELIRKHQAKEIIVCLDGDTKVKDTSKDKAWNMALRLSQNKNKNISIMRLPLEHDPDSCPESLFDGCFAKRFEIKDKDDWLFESL